MILKDFLSTLKTADIKVTIYDASDTDTELIKFYAGGYEGVESDLLAKTIKKWEINSGVAVTVILNAAASSVEPSNEEDD